MALDEFTMKLIGYIFIGIVGAILTYIGATYDEKISLSIGICLFIVDIFLFFL